MTIFSDRPGYLPPDAKEIALHQQLFRYAEDMKTLIEDHSTLEERHRVLQKAYDRTSNTFRALDRLLDGAPDLYIVTDIHGVIGHCNPACSVLCPPETLIGSSLFDYSTPETRAVIRTQIAAALGDHPSVPDQSTANSQLLYLNALSGQRLIITVSSVQSFEDDQREHIHWLLRDVTRQRESEFENQLATMVYSNATEGILITDVKGTILAVNPAFSQITGYSAEEVLEKTPKLLNSGVHDEEFYQTMWRNIRENGSWRTEIYNRKKSGEVVPLRVTVNSVKNTNGEVLSYIAIYTDLTRLQEAEKQLAYLAYHDPLTGLPNRSLFKDRIKQTLSHARRGSYEVTMFFIDLDRFKPINDTLGHEVGDVVLKEVARRLEQVSRDVDTVARIGGDEFVILAPGLSGRERIVAFGQKIIDALAKPFPHDERTLSVGCSIGAASYPTDGDNEDRLITHADHAMYRAKDNGGSDIVCFSDISEETDTAHISVEQELRKALIRNQLAIVYQPQFRMSGSDRTIGVEAFLRWKHPTLGSISPEVFIPVAERTGSIQPIGSWVLKSACSQLAMWQAEGINNLRLTVNISSRQLRDPEFVELVRETVLSTGIGASNLELEISEREILNDITSGVGRLSALRALGVRVVVDDLGSGYANLSRLRTLPIDRLKINRAFVRTMGENQLSDTVAGSVIDLANALNLEVMAEGVEAEGQLEALSAMGCRLVQGFLLAKPMSANDTYAFLKHDGMPLAGCGSSSNPIEAISTKITDHPQGE